jgi:hypothetical protein
MLPPTKIFYHVTQVSAIHILSQFSGSTRRPKKKSHKNRAYAHLTIRCRRIHRKEYRHLLNLLRPGRLIAACTRVYRDRLSRTNGDLQLAIVPDPEPAEQKWVNRPSGENVKALLPRTPLHDRRPSRRACPRIRCSRSSQAILSRMSRSMRYPRC